MKSQAWSPRSGRPDLATEAMGINQGDVYVLLKPRDQWRTVHTKEELIDDMSAALEQIPGVSYNFTQPMAMRLDEVVSGIKADVALKIFGEDPRVLEQQAEQALRLISTVPGAADAQMEIVSGVAELRVDVDRKQLARYGLNVSDVREVIETAIGGRYVARHDRRPAALRHRSAPARAVPPRSRGDARACCSSRPAASAFRWARWRTWRRRVGPEVISRENGQRRIVVQSNVRGRDLGGFVADAQKKVAAGLHLPARVFHRWGGQFENQQRATRRLMIVLPAAILIIFGLLFATFNSVPQALLILLNVPFALVGGIAALWLRGLNLNLSASVGFIALFGVAVLNGIVHGELHQPAADRGHRYAICHPGGRRGAAASGADDRAGGQSRLRPDGGGHLGRRGGAAAAGDRGDRRPGHLDLADAAGAAGGVSVVLQKRCAGSGESGGGGSSPCIDERFSDRRLRGLPRLSLLR